MIQVRTIEAWQVHLATSELVDVCWGHVLGELEAMRVYNDDNWICHAACMLLFASGLGAIRVHVYLPCLLFERAGCCVPSLPCAWCMCELLLFGRRALFCRV